MLIEAVSARRAAELCGFRSVAMLDYLQRSGVFSPARKRGLRRGKGRAYDFRDLLALKAIKRLLDGGASVAAIRTALVEFQKGKWVADQASLEHESGKLRYLVASGNRVFFVSGSEGLVELSDKGQLAFSFIIDLDKLHSELCFEIAQAKLPLAL